MALGHQSEIPKRGAPGGVYGKLLRLCRSYPLGCTAKHLVAGLGLQQKFKEVQDNGQRRQEPAGSATYTWSTHSLPIPPPWPGRVMASASPLPSKSHASSCTVHPYLGSNREGILGNLILSVSQVDRTRGSTLAIQELTVGYLAIYYFNKCSLSAHHLSKH